MDKKIIKNFIYNSIYQIMIIFLPFITIPYISRIFSPKDLGIFSVTNSVASFFCTIGMFALNSYAGREIAIVRDNKNDLSIKYYEIRFLQKIMIIASSFVYILIFIIFNNKYMRSFYIIQFINLIASYFDIAWLYIGLEEFGKTVKRNTIVKLSGIFLIFLFVKGSSDLSIYILILPLVALIGNLSMWPYKRKLINKVKLKTYNLNRNFFGALFLFIPTICSNIYLVFDRTLLGWVNSLYEVGMYDQSQKIIRVIIGVVTSLGLVMLPRISNLIKDKNKNKNEIDNLMKKSFDLTLFISVGSMVGLLAISNNFVPWFYGNQYIQVINLIKISSPVCVLTAISSFFYNQYAIPNDNKNAYIIPNIIAAITSIILNLMLGKFWGAIGSCITIIIVEFLTLGLRMFYLKNDIKFKKIFKGIYKFLVSGLIMFIVIKFVDKIFNLQCSIITTCIEILVGFLVYCIVIIILNKLDK